MWSRRMAVLAAVLPLAVVVTWDAPAVVGSVPALPGAGPERRALPAVERPAGAPEVITRVDWGADESLRTEKVTYTGAARAVFVHHTNHPGDYDCADVPAMLRAMQSDHVMRMGWDDLGYNFVVDKCGTIYEGRAGGVRRFVLGAHTTGFNMDTVGVAALGSFDDGQAVPEALVKAIADLAAWKLRPGTDPRGEVRLVSSNDNSRVPEGDQAEMHVISGHRDSGHTQCPGDELYEVLPMIREEAARLRVRSAEGRAAG
ncbi:peptidoglycan recognition protein [Streptomyces sp. DSM 44917]|uniref:Peptidoglycan recognition protein n=1 Tax=Streptomyces boetiae TaxID=3075541 RepID=A0ABU2LDT3_9ACTN|nr:peptidoglycan recognition protein [Streptomyces sp. DSM 44917]MDT0309738.1 peptidoglycan recognition protein [Streptomyces sp. DSM 44917]